MAQAQTQALFRGWAPLIALQIEYSLIERTVEGELVPMALELGLGITPWSPLRGGVLSGKYTRENAGTMKADRGERVTNFLTERNYMIIDELIRIGRELACSAGLRCAGLAAGAARCRLHDHRRATPRPARTEPGGAGRHAGPAATDRTQFGIGTVIELPCRDAEVRDDVYARWDDGERCHRAGLAAGAEVGRRAALATEIHEKKPRRDAETTTTVVSLSCASSLPGFLLCGGFLSAG